MNIIVCCIIWYRNYVSAYKIFVEYYAYRIHIVHVKYFIFIPDALIYSLLRFEYVILMFVPWLVVHVYKTAAYFKSVLIWYACKNKNKWVKNHHQLLCKQREIKTNQSFYIFKNIFVFCVQFAILHGHVDTVHSSPYWVPY